MTFNQGWLSPPQAISVISKNITGNQALGTGHYFDLWVKAEKDRKHPSFRGQPKDSSAHSSPETYGNILLYKVNAVLMEFQQPPLKTQSTNSRICMHSQRTQKIKTAVKNHAGVGALAQPLGAVQSTPRLDEKARYGEEPVSMNSVPPGYRRKQHWKACVKRNLNTMKDEIVN